MTGQAARAETQAWPKATAQSRPWTRWWWMGSALPEAEITRQLTVFSEAGFGGVEVSPIYGVRGYEDRWVPFLSPRWMELFAHTLREADRLGMGVDLICGTGWPFGGPWVTDADAARRAWIETLPIGKEAHSAKQPEAATMVTGEAGGKQYALFLAPTGQEVKRAAPGGEGNVLDHFHADAVRRYLQRFDAALDTLPDGLRPRSFFNDSWEVFGANATPDLREQFRARRGYDLAEHLHHLNGVGDADTVRRVRSDFRETIEDLTREAFLGTWTGWARERGSLSRNQAHGSPGNLLDLYAAADIPEVEVFGPVRLRLAGLEPPSPSLPPDFGEEEELLMCKMASSAAHVSGRSLCSSESFTWLGEHGHVPLEHMKAEADLLFATGINHLFFHGTPGSPEDVPWPGWLFYATTHCAPTNPFWRDLPALNAYITRCQSWLQQGQPDSDVLLYFPFYDLLAKEAGAHDLLQFLTVGRTATWLRGNLPEFAATAALLWNRGWAYDLVSDRQLTEHIAVDDGRLTSTGGLRCRALLVAGCRTVPPATVERWLALARSGATILFTPGLPETVPGLGNLEEREARLHAAWAGLGAENREGEVRRWRVGAGQILCGPDAAGLLETAGVSREPMADAGIEFCRRRIGEDLLYFVSNPGQTDFRGWLAVEPGTVAMLFDPTTEDAGPVRVQEAGAYLELPAGASRLLRVGTGMVAGPEWKYRLSDRGEVLTGSWRLEFIEGGPDLPETRELAELQDWTTLGGTDAERLQAFSGTARYTRVFDLSDPEGAWQIDLGRVCSSARVRLNGQMLGTVLARPWQVTVPPGLLRPTGNRLEIEVTNLMANRLAEQERREKAAWRPFLLVNIHYKPFEAHRWKPTPSGLLGPVRLLYLTD